jgi:NADH:ubiquinone oxidoreductase subunit F (NADH-binding)
MGWSVGAGVDAGGAAANPTIVNNVETLATVPQILVNGPEWYRALGSWDSPGTMVFTVVGDVVRPGYAELELGTTVRDVITHVGGGTRPGRRVKAVFSGVAHGTPTPSRPYRLPKIVDMAHSTVTYDAGTAPEQPDWTYVDVRRA